MSVITYAVYRVVTEGALADEVVDCVCHNISCLQGCYRGCSIADEVVDCVCHNVCCLQGC